MKRLISLLALFAVTALARAETLDLGTHGSLSFAVPKGWTYSVQKEEDNGYAVTISPPAGVNAKLLMNVTFVPEPRPITKEEVNEKVLSICEQFVDASVEKKSVLRDFAVPAPSFGSYCVFTDASLVGQPAKADEFKVIGVGILRFSDDVMAAVSLASDDEKGADFAAMLGSATSAVLTPRK